MVAYVSLSEAARLAGISRSTLYERIKNGQLSTTRSHNGKPTVQISELIRVFGDALQLPDSVKQARTVESDTYEQVSSTLAGQSPRNTEQHSTPEADSPDMSEQQIRTLSARVVQLEAELVGLRLVLAAKDQVIEAQRSAQARLDAQLEIAQVREKVQLLEGPTGRRRSFWNIFGG